MALTYCNDCRTTHLPHQHGARSATRSKGRHLAPSSRSTFKIPPAEELGERTFRALGSLGERLRSQAKGLWEAISRQLDGAPDRLRGYWKQAVEFSGLLEESGRRRAASRHARRPPSSPAPVTDPTRTMVRAGVGVMEYSSVSQPLLEVSMLERLGFYDGEDSMVVTLAPAAPVPLAPLAGPRRPLIPDLELDGWKPHVIARSKLATGSFRATTIGITGLIGLCLLILAVAVVRGPNSAVAEEELTVPAQSLATALGDLESELTGTDSTAIDATASLAAIDVAARDLFLAASRLEAEDQGAIRASATEISHEALDLESRITEALSYRLVLAPLWHSPDLMGVTDATIAAEALAPWQAQMTEVAGALPTGTGIEEHARTVADFVADFPAWAQAYLDALAVSDTTTAEAMAAELESRLAQLAQTEEETVNGILTGVRQEAATLAGEIEGLLVGLSNP